MTTLEKGRSPNADAFTLSIRSIAQARQSLEEAAEILGKVNNPLHSDILIADILRREAETLLKELERK